MSEFLRGNKRGVLITLLVIFLASLLFLLIYSGSFQFNPISPDSEDTTLSIQIDNPAFLWPFIIAVLSLVGIFLVLFFTRSNEHMLGTSSVKRDKKEVMENFLNAVIMTNSKATDKNYTLHLLEKLKKKNDRKGFDLITLSKNKPYFAVDGLINQMSDSKFKNLIQIILDGFSSSGDADDPFMSILRTGMSHELSRALESYGIVIED